MVILTTRCTYFKSFLSLPFPIYGINYLCLVSSYTFYFYNELFRYPLFIIEVLKFLKRYRTQPAPDLTADL